jgi:hypothetical protein
MCNVQLAVGLLISKSGIDRKQESTFENCVFIQHATSGSMTHIISLQGCRTSINLLVQKAPATQMMEDDVRIRASLVTVHNVITILTAE